MSIVVMSVALVSGVTLDAYRPILYKHFFDVATSQGPAAAGTMVNIILMVLLVGIGVRIVWTVLLRSISYLESRVMSDLLNTSYEYLLHHSYNFFNNSFIGSLVTKVRRFQNAYEQIADQVFLDTGRTILIAVVILGVLLYSYPVLGVIALGWSLFFIALTVAFSRYKIPHDIARADADTKTTGHLADTLANNMNLKLFASIIPEVETFHRITDNLFRLRKYAWNLGNNLDVIQGVLVLLLEFGMIYISVGMWQRGLLTIGDFVLIQSYISRIIDKLWGLGGNIRRTYEALADANEMTEMLLTPHEITDIKNAGELVITQGRIEFNDVEFHYSPATPILKHFNMAIAAGERVALVGPSGGGKSTLVKLLFRFLDIQGGHITIDGANISEVTQDSLRRSISLVPQEPILFHRSLIDNIRYGKPDATDKQVIAAAKAAHCHEFIEKFPEKYETLVGERGVKLSGGERQRVAIARAILKNAPILVLDEATSSLDSESESYIQDALRTLMQGKTTIVVAHRLSTIMQMDRIIVIEDGKVREEGKHEELIKAKQGMYQKLWNIQAGGFGQA